MTASPESKYAVAMSSPADVQIASIAGVIQLAVAPVFLLTGIGAMLGVLTSRLARVVDRARSLEAQYPTATPAGAEALKRLLGQLARRARLANWAISLMTSAAILVSTVIVVLFVGDFVGTSLVDAVALLFVAAMSCLIAGLLCFLREVYLATRYVRIGVPEEPM